VNKRLSAVKRAAGFVAMLLLAAPAVAQTIPDSALVGVYDGGQMELAAQLELGADGRYRYELAYGAASEASAGTWASGQGGIVLTSDPSTAPTFELLSDTAVDDREVVARIVLDVPENLPRELFGAVVTLADGSAYIENFTTDGLTIPVTKSEQITAIRMALPMLQVLGEERAISPGEGRALHFAFHANDLGFVPFDHFLLPKERDGFALNRYDRRIVFRKMADDRGP
jgi:hypothetical protein